MNQRVFAIIGFGEAGSTFARGLAAKGVQLTAYDILLDDPATAGKVRARAEGFDVVFAASTAEAVAGAELVISTVTADQTVIAAEAAAPGLDAETLYVDLNSTSPPAKAAAAAAIEAAGGHFVEAVAMDTVANFGLAVPLIACGPWAQTAAEALVPLGFNIDVVSDQLGAASAIKLMRSVVVKGIEAVLAEALLGAVQLGAVDTVLESLNRTYPGLDWQAIAQYHLARLAQHGRRRAAELEKSAETLAALGVEPILATAIAARQRWAAEKNLAATVSSTDPPDLETLIKLLSTT